MLMYKLLELNLNLQKPTCFLSFHHIFVPFSFFRATQLEKHARYATAKATGLPFVPRSSELTHLCSSVLVFFGPIETQTLLFIETLQLMPSVGFILTELDSIFFCAVCHLSVFA